MSSGSVVFCTSLLSSRKTKASTSRFPSDLVNTGRQAGRNKPHTLMSTSISRKVLRAFTSRSSSYGFPADGRLSGSLTNRLSARSATHWISCWRLCRVDGSTVNSLASRCMRTLSTSLWPSAITAEKKVCNDTETVWKVENELNDQSKRGWWFWNKRETWTMKDGTLVWTNQNWKRLFLLKGTN